MPKDTNIFDWLCELPHENLAALVRLGNEDMTFGTDNWSQLSELRVRSGEFAMVLLLRRSGGDIVESGLVHFDEEWEPLHPVTLEQMNKLQRRVIFADILSEFPTCPVTAKATEEPENEEMEALFEEALNLEWPASVGSTDWEAAEAEIAPLARLLAWLESLPSDSLRATIYLGDSSMEFSKANWKNMTGFGRAADDRDNGEIIVSRTGEDGVLSVAGLLFTGKWFVLAPSGVRADHGSKYPVTSKYLPFDELLPGCPI